MDVPAILSVKTPKGSANWVWRTDRGPIEALVPHEDLHIHVTAHGCTTIQRFLRAGELHDNLTVELVLHPSPR